MAKVTDFAPELCSRYGLTSDEAADFINMMFDVVREQLDSSDKQVKIKGLGTFKVTSVGARASVDVNTGERIILEGRNKISFTPEVLLRDRVNRPFVQFETVVLNDGVDFSEIDREYEADKNAQESVVEPESETEQPDDSESAEVPNLNVGLPSDAQPTSAPSVAAPLIDPYPVDTISSNVNNLESSSVDTNELSEESADGSMDSVESSNEPSVELSEEKPIETSEEKYVESSEEKSVESSEEKSVESSEELSVGNSEKSTKLTSPDEFQSTSVPLVCKQRNPRLMYWLTAASFALLVVIGIGMYFIYRQIETKNAAIEQLQTRLSEHSATAAKSKAVHHAPVKAKPSPHPAPADTASKHSESLSSAPVQPKEQQPTATSAADYNYDVRVRTGAYVIVGTDKTVTVKSGQTLESLSRSNLGPGMECYIEVYNGVKSVKAGDKIKIPKLKLKKLHKAN